MGAEDLSHIYDVESYKWDGNERPNIEDYTAPWSEVASMTDAKWNTENWRKYQNAVNYARNQLKIAESQYMADLDYWNERDSRDYNDPVSQTNRYEEAGYNLGYLYGSVESGNTSSGYSSPSSDIGEAGSDAPDKDASDVMQIVVAGVKVVTDLAKTGIDLSKLPTEIAIQKVTHDDIYQSSLMKALQNRWTKFLRQIGPNGEKLDDTENLVDSFAFALESAGLKHAGLTNQQLSSFVKYCGQIYENQATDFEKDIMQDVDNIIKDVDNSAVRAILKLLAVMALGTARQGNS